MNKGNSEILNRVFSKNTLKSFISGEPSVAFCTSISRYIKNEDGTNLKKISEIYEYLCKNYRNEYCYKNSLLNNLLVHSPNHNLKSTSALTEINVSKSKPDFILINGKSIVYEIKTGLDNFERLETQLNDYYKAFDNVIVITDKLSIDKLIKVLDTFENTGIAYLDDDLSIKTVRESKSVVDKLDMKVMFKILRKYEFENIIKACYNYLPEVSQFKYYDACYELISKLDIHHFFNLFKTELKKRTVIIEDKFMAIPDELKMLAYFSSLKEKDYERLNVFLNKPYIIS